MTSMTPDEADDNPEGWLRRCWIEGITAAFGEKLPGLGQRVAEAEISAEQAVAMRAFTAMAAMGRGDYELADQLLGSQPGATSLPPPLRLLDSAARLYRACGDAERDPQRAMAAMQALSEIRAQVGPMPGSEAATARGYAGLALAEALLMVGDVGAARHQLELVLEEGRAPPALLMTVRCIIGGIEHAVGRADLSVGHLQAAVRAAVNLPAEEQLGRLLLIGVIMIENRRYGLALLDELVARNRGVEPTGQGTVARLYRMLRLLLLPGPPGPAQRIETRDLLRFLQGRHYSAGWFLLLTSVCAGALRAAGDPCEAYSVLIHAAATLRCRRMDGAADLCDRQIEALRGQLGEDAFEALLREARQRRQVFLAEATQAQAAAAPPTR